MERYIKSPRSAETAFNHSIQPINVYTKVRRTSSIKYANEKIHYDGTLSIFKLIGFRPLFVAITREGVQCISQEIIDTHNFIKEAYARALPYKNIFIYWVSRVFFDLRRKITNYSSNHITADKKQLMGTSTENPLDDVIYQDSENYDDRCDDYDSHSVFSNADTDISSPQHRNTTDPAKVAELENEVLILKQQLSLILQQMNINIPQPATQTLPLTSSLPPPIVNGPRPPPPPPLPENLFKPSEVVIKPPKQSDPENNTNPQTVPRITEILGDLSKVQLRRVPRSPGGTPCRNRVLSSGTTMADAVKNAMDKRRKDFDVSMDENGLNDSWEEEKET
uniref:WH1 domain-containing protein n=1 Tax=Panagrolaimus sp. ES5 TaxID=591445 RepID=A0AC34FC15_9BILA